jgi:8-oxo-dGTP pyrophosphatase MutT (NUDIX family)
MTKTLAKGIDCIGVTVSFLCHDGQGNVLLNLRSVNCRDEHGRWDGGGGSMEFGDSAEATLKREIKEEYGADLLQFDFLGYRDIFREHNGVQTHWLSLDFKVLIDPAQVKNGEPHKFDDLRWFPLTQLPTPLHSQFPLFMKKYGSHLHISK